MGRKKISKVETAGGESQAMRHRNADELHRASLLKAGDVVMVSVQFCKGDYKGPATVKKHEWIYDAE